MTAGMEDVLPADAVPHKVRSVSEAVRALLFVVLVACSSESPGTADAGVTGDAAADAAVVVVDPARSMITTDLTQGIAGVDHANITVILRTASGAPAVGASVQLRANGDGNMFSVPAPTNAVGQTSATYTSTVAGAKTVSAQIGGLTLVGPVITFGPGTLAKLGFGVQPTAVVAGAPFSPAVRVESQDAFGNFVPTGTGYATLSLGANPGSTFLRGDLTLLLANGFATFPATHIDVAATGYTLRAQSSTGLAMGTSAAFDVTPGVPDPARSSIAAVPHSLEANGLDTTLVTFHVANAYGIAIAAQQVSVMVSGTNNTLVPASGATDNQGNFRPVLSSTAAEVKTIKGTAGTAEAMNTVNFYGPSCRPQLPGGPMPVIDAFVQAFHVADVDGDGKLDAIAGYYQTIAVFRGKGDGSFYPPIDNTITTTGMVNAIASGDFNSDGKLDLVVAIEGTSAFTLMLGAGNGQFTAQSIALPGSATHLAVADVNLDSRPDLIAALGTVVVVELGNGNGTFSAGATINAPAGDLAILDANLDNKPDIVFPSTLQLVTALGAGNGTFPTLTTVSAYQGKLLVGNFNGDGAADVAIAEINGTLTTFLGSGAGTFSVGPATQFHAPQANGYVSGGGAADLDGDGFQDLVIGGAVLKGTGTGAFTVQARYYASAAILAEMTGDGHLDMVGLSGHGVRVAAGTSTLAFVAPREVFASNESGARLYGTVADFNGDQRGDYIRFRSNNPDSGMNVLLAQPGLGVVQATSGADTAPSPYDAVAGDFTGDGKQDLAIVRAEVSGVDLGIAVGNGTGALGALTTQNVSFPYATDMIGADFNRDGKQDLVLYRAGEADFAIALSTGTGFSISPIYASPKTGSVVVADVSADGIPDVVVAGTYAFSTEFRVYLGSATGTLTLAGTYGTSPLTGKIAVGDMTNDGVPDLVFLDASSVTQATDRRTMYVYPNQGTGTFDVPIVTPNIRIPKLLDVGRLHILDITGDGNADILVHSTFGTGVIAGFGDGYVRQSPFHYWIGVQGGTSTDPIVLNDHDGDSRIDLAYWSFGLYVARNTGCVF